MPRNASNKTNYNILSVSSLAETAINTAQTCDMSLLVGMGDIANFEARKEVNDKQATGLSGPDRVYDLGRTGKMSWNFDMLKPVEAIMMAAYCMGKVTTTAAGTGYLHTVEELEDDYEMGIRGLPTFTMCDRLGKTVAARRWYSAAIPSCSFNFTRDQWVKGKAEVVTSGKFDSAFIEEVVAALDNVTALTLAANAVLGADAQERLNNVQYVHVLYNGGERYLTPTAVSDATPAVITIPSLGGAGGTVSYTVKYAASPAPTWTTYPPAIEESALRVSDLCVVLDGTWNGTEFVGGTPLGSRLDSFDLSLKNDLKMEFTACAGGAYAGRCLKGVLDAEIKLASDMYDELLDETERSNKYFGIWALCEGVEYDTGHKYTFEIICPKCVLMTVDTKDKDKRLSQDSNVKVLAPAGYSKVIIRGKDLWPTFIA